VGGRDVQLEAGERGDSEDEEEGLFDPWVPPSWGEALRHRAAATFHGGTAALWGTSIDDIGDDCGVGITLYLRFLRTFALFFAAATVLALPALLSNGGGKGIPAGKIDPMGFARWSFGNQGVHRDNVDASFCGDGDVAAGVATASFPYTTSHAGECVSVSAAAAAEAASLGADLGAVTYVVGTHIRLLGAKLDARVVAAGLSLLDVLASVLFLLVGEAAAAAAAAAAH